MLLARLAEAGRRYRTPTDHFVRLLRGWGWECVEGATFQDAAGRRFSLVSSSLIHIMSLLMWHWGSVIRDAVQHRKGLEQVGVVHMVQVAPLGAFCPRNVVCWVSWSLIDISLRMRDLTLLVRIAMNFARMHVI